MSKPIEIVQKIYQAFGAGDVETILAQLAPEVQWEYAYSGSSIPWLVPRRGRAEVVKFFTTLQSMVEIEHFDVAQLLSGHQLVVALVNLEFTVKATGKRVVESDEPHVWRFDDQGQVVRFRHAADTLQHAMALEP